MSETKRRVATKEELRNEITALRSVGAQMANICFNLGQNTTGLPREGRLVDRHTLIGMEELRRKWDAIARAEGRS